jgi:hypothetical protein
LVRLLFGHLIVLNWRCVIFHRTLRMLIRDWDRLTTGLNPRKSILLCSVSGSTVCDSTGNAGSVFSRLRTRELGTDLRILFGVWIYGSASAH